MPINLKKAAPAASATPAAGYSQILVDADGNWGSKDSAGVFTKFGAGAVTTTKASLDFNHIKRILPFGDSITQNNSILNNGAWQLGGGYAENALRKAGRFTVLANAGVGGNTVAQMRARLQTDVIALKPDAVLFMAGTNSIVDGITLPQMAAVMNDYEYIVQQLIAANIVPILVTPPAKGQVGLAGATNTGWKETRNFIPFLYSLAHYYGLPLIDVFKFTVDPVTSGFRTGMSDDNVHPAAGISAIGDYVAWHLQNLTKAINQVYLSGVAESVTGSLHNILQNGTFSLASTANQPDYWGANANTGATLSNTSLLVPVGSDTPVGRSSGNLFSYKVTANPGRYALSGGVDLTAFTAGDVLEFSGRVTINGPAYATAQGVTVGLDLNGVNANVRPINVERQNQDGLFSQEFKVPAGVTGMTCSAYTQDLGTYTFNNFTLVNKTKRDSYWKPGTTQV